MNTRFMEELPKHLSELDLAGSEDDEMEDNIPEDYEEGYDADDDDDEEDLALFLAESAAQADRRILAVLDEVDKIRKEQQREFNSVGSHVASVTKVSLGQHQKEVIDPGGEQRQSKRKREGPRDGISNHVTRTLKDGTIVRGKQGATFAGFIPRSRIPKQAPILRLARNGQKPPTPELTSKTTSTTALDDSALTTSTEDIGVQRADSTSTKRDFSDSSSDNSLSQISPLPKRIKPNPE
ncbi:hypothetical protein F4824DRAFT_496018 [Ustulina deusta]|nr:hypothetical protein F4824DRAFT_496018 [Ustulina deusta]